MSVSPSRSPIKKQKSEGFGKISGPFVRDTSVIIEKFVESVKDLFQHCYTDKDLYSEIHKMSEDELFANLGEYLEDIKFAIFEALSENLDKISLKFLQICDRQEKFNKYLRVLKEKWRNSSSSLKGHHRHDDKYIRSAKDFVNKLADKDIDSQRSRSRRGSKIKPQTHFSDFDSVNRLNGTVGTSSKKTTKNRPQASQTFSTYQDMPLTSSGLPGAQKTEKAEKPGSSRTPQKSNYASKSGLSPSRPLTNSPGKGYASKGRPGTGQHSNDAVTRLIEKREDHTAFTRDIIDPHTGLIVKCLCPTDTNRVLLGLEMGKIIEVIPETDKAAKVTSLIYSGSHTIYDLVIDHQDRLFFFDGSYSLRMISYDSDKTEEISHGEYWDQGKQIRLNKKANRLLFRKSDKVLLEFKLDEEKVLPSRGVRLDEGNIADFTYSLDGKFIYIVTDDGILRFRSKNLDKDYVIDKKGQYFAMALSSDGKHLAITSNFSDGTVTEHSVFVFELQGTKDPLFVHKITFMTEFAQDWIRQLTFDISVRGENLIAGCTNVSCMLVTFALRQKKLEQFQKEFSLTDNNDVTFSSLSTKSNTLWLCSTENKLNRLSFK